MWLLHVVTKKLDFFHRRNVPKYAILSHRWEEEEVGFAEWMINESSLRRKQGYIKIAKCCDIVQSRGFDYVWIDTCCINKESSAELQEAINSMYNWYKQAAICIAYLSDTKIGTKSQKRIGQSAWFTRGWTLQELLAPTYLFFYDKDWNCVGSKVDKHIASSISTTTGIPYQAIARFTPRRYSIAARMSWAAKRETSREEDRAYSLLGIFDINMPMLYGEGEAAFQRLQEEIVRRSDDRSIFLWSGNANPDFGIFAAGSDSFTDSSLRLVVKALPASGVAGYTVTNAGLSIELDIEPINSLLWIAYLGSALINGRRRLFGIYVVHNEENRQANCFKRVSVAGKYWMSVDFAAIDQTNIRTIHAVIVRQPMEDHIIDASFEFVIKSLPFDHLFNESTVSVDHESEPSRHVIRRPKEEGHSFLGSIYGLSLQETLILVTVGVDAPGRPLCVLDFWPQHLTQEAFQSFGLEEDFVANYLPVRTASAKSQLRSTFNALHEPESDAELDPTGGFMITFRGQKESISGFIFRATAFEFRPSENGFELLIRASGQPFESSDRFAVWPVEHQIYQLDHHSELLQDYHSNLAGQLRDARFSAARRDNRNWRKASSRSLSRMSHGSTPDSES